MMGYQTIGRMKNEYQTKTRSDGTMHCPTQAPPCGYEDEDV